MRTFVDEGASMGELLKEAAARGIAPVYADRLLAVFDKEARLAREEVSRLFDFHPQSLIYPLNERELQELCLLDSLLYQLTSASARASWIACSSVIACPASQAEALLSSSSTECNSARLRS